MIALNELIKNHEHFKSKYALMGKAISFDKIFKLEKSFRLLQQQTEQMRANCNKLCGQIAEIRSQNGDVKPNIEQINSLNKMICKNNKSIEYKMKKLNKFLEKLPNVAEYDNTINIQLKTAKKTSNLNELEQFLNTISQVLPYDEDENGYLKAKANAIFEDLPVVAKCKDDYVILTKQLVFDKTKNTILDYLTNNSEHIIQISCKKLPKYCSAAYLVHLNAKNSLYFEIIREYKTRRYKLKYHDKTSDMTKFLNQMTIKTI